MRRNKKIVVVKLQRPVTTNGSGNNILSYIVDEDGEQASNPIQEEMSDRDIKELFDGHYKVFWRAEYRKGKKLKLLAPVRVEDWV